MVERNLLQLLDGLGSTEYCLTSSGWIEGLKLTGLFDDPLFHKKAGQLSKALKDKVKDRQEYKLTNKWELASETGLSESFIFNAINSHLATRNV